MKIFTNGCFDVLTPGHESFLHHARSLGTSLVVAVNTDASVRRLKGPSRPILPLADRMAMLEAIRWVDEVVSFDTEDDLRDLIRRYRPDVLVKGGDYADRPITGVDLMGERGKPVKLIPILDGHSTTGLIERIRAAHD